jgi:hypothetical protein
MSRPQIRETLFGGPLYPEIHVQTASNNPFALVAAVRLALRQAQVGHPEIDRFTREALSGNDSRTSRRVCRSWVTVGEGGGRSRGCFAVRKENRSGSGN